MVLLWTIALLAEYPDVQRKCANEINTVIGPGNKPLLKHRGKLPYLEATIMEVLRYSSITPLALPHTTTMDTSVSKLHYFFL